ncbi:hypothetical protein PROFUN_16729 [Planoprotostelium fungivorum]|uniref:Uncharacterized protein n=1 Tax=Planoprotostelium fungivorum TaxID=1890364 RepID=A0A2P6MPN8_9EUKA|nr:hypothetical protein PROFUN_16729 [Planoprotostelium fungivorum]
MPGCSLSCKDKRDAPTWARTRNLSVNSRTRYRLRHKSRVAFSGQGDRTSKRMDVVVGLLEISSAHDNSKVTGAFL